MVFLLKLMCPSKIIGTSQTGHTNLGKTSALSSYSCGCRSLRKLRDGGCWDHYISPPASQSQCPCSQLGAPHGDIRQGHREPGGGLHSRWGWGQQQEGARGEQALSGLALPRWSVLLRGCDIFHLIMHLFIHVLRPTMCKKIIIISPCGEEKGETRANGQR